MSYRAVLLLVLTSLALAQQPVRNVTDPGVITTRQAISPAGVQSVFEGRVYGAAFAGSTNEIWVLAAREAVLLDWRRNAVRQRATQDGLPGLQGVMFDAASGAPLMTGTRKGSPAAVSRLATVRGGAPVILADGIGQYNAGAPHAGLKPNRAGQRLAAVPLIYNNRVALFDLEAGRSAGEAPAGIAPFAVAVSEASDVAYVTNWGGRVPLAGEPTAPTGLQPNADRVVIDSRGVAASGTVTRIDLVEKRATGQINVGLQPTGLAWDQPRHRLYVANSNGDSVSVIDTRRDAVVATFALQPFGTPVSGIAPTAVAVSPDGATLYVTCGGINAIAVLDAQRGTQRGLIPTAWYPNSVSLSPDGTHLAVTTLLGVGSGFQNEPARRFVHAYRGSVAVIALPDEAQLLQYTAAVAENNRMPMQPAQTARRRAKPAPKAIPVEHGDPSLIEHVVYIIKENRTYDQVFGDLTEGNGEPSFVMFGEDVAPNHRKLAREFVLLDNFYATGGNSGDGHQWVTQANETAYPLWPGYQGRSYPFDGTDPIAYSQSGFIWDGVARVGRSVRVYGEFVGRMADPPSSARMGLLREWEKGADFSSRWTVRSDIPPLNSMLAAYFPSYTNAIPDVARAQILLKDIARWTQEGKMPNFVIVQLPCDHTYGTAPNLSTPKAMVADNDLAMGQLVEALSKSPFWKKMAIFVVEDDAQNGVDHVDGHRTVALAISPYTRRGTVDSTFYAQQSMVKTIELILGAPPMTLFDRIATDMRASFTDTPDATPYSHVKPKQDLFEANPPLNALRGQAKRDAQASAKMRWEVPDAAPSDQLNRILWRAVMGADRPFPGVRRAVFAPLAIDLEDDERE
ncbi:MAG: hypothetical protein IPM24_15645 [Bryobacterales bacterium]|nr:hypothetical protein [Bryobacterales bacterium]